MALAYLFLVHQLPEQLARLVSRLWSPDDSFFVHVDAKVDIEPFRKALAPFEGVRFTERVRCEWAGFGLVDATLRGVRAVLDADRPFGHLVLLSGQDYPIKPVAEYRAFMAAHADRSFLSWCAGHPDEPTPPPGWDGNSGFHWNGRMERFERRFYRVRGRYVSFPNRFLPFPSPRRMPMGMQPYEGSQYWHLTPDAVRYVVDLVERRPDVLRFFHRTMIPDEKFFQMVLVNSPLAAGLVNDDLRYVDWTAGAWHPETLTMADAAALEASPKFFARKFDPRVDAAVLDHLDALVAR